MELIQYTNNLDSLFLKYYERSDLNRYMNKGKYFWLSLFGIYHSDFYVFCDDKNIAGCILIRAKLSKSLKKEKWIYDVFIFPEYRGKGLSKEMMMLALDKCSTDVQLSVSNDNIVALNLYRRIGFYPIGSRNNEVIMRYDKI